jgi:YegS/Rv2252/BmrU family lipid kinase
MKKLLFLYNPTAGTGKVRARLGEIVDRFIPFGYEVTLHPTQYRGDATEFVRERGAEFDRVVCAGGDGTLNEVVSGILDLKHPPQLGYIPTGSTNDFSRTLKLPGDLLAAADCSVMGTVRKIDVGMLNDRCFIYVAAFGLFTDVSYSTPQNLKNALGHLAYILQGAAQLGNIKT